MGIGVEFAIQRDTIVVISPGGRWAQRSSSASGPATAS